jgi:hypothetical protein
MLVGEFFCAGRGMWARGWHGEACEGDVTADGEYGYGLSHACSYVIT